MVSQGRLIKFLAFWIARAAASFLSQTRRKHAEAGISVSSSSRVCRVEQNSTALTPSQQTLTRTTITAYAAMAATRLRHQISQTIDANSPNIRELDRVAVAELIPVSHTTTR